MGRSKQMGKPVAELTPAELQSELHRCRTYFEALPHTVAAKLLRKRLRQIERRLESAER